LTSSSLNEPWLLRPDYIPLSTIHKRDFVLVSGSKSQACSQTNLYSLFVALPPAPSERSVAILLVSPSLVQSLVIFASHYPPSLPPSLAPSVRILILASPLVIEDTGAVRLT
jgi:hypothetical protein